MQLTFLGATQTVTGSKYLLEMGSKVILIDCGLFQGYKELRLRNWERFPVNPGEIDAVIVTHAHIDHTGYLPLLVKNGFKGPIYATPGTKALSSILLPDSGHLQEADAKFANKQGFSKHRPALPLYTELDARKALLQFEVVDFGISYPLLNQGTFELSRAGHIIGASFVKIKNDATSVLFTGDIGRPHDLVMQAPTVVDEIDYLVMESTYGDRLHDATDPLLQLGNIINQTTQRGGSVIIPAFAVGRAQALLYYIYLLKKSGKIPDIPVFLDSPMAINATQILRTYREDHRLDIEQCKGLCSVATYVNTPEESKQIDYQKKMQIIISASGMLEGGRILHHLKVFGPDHRNTIILTGYQAGGTRGARLLKGERELKIHGQMVPIQAQVEVISSISAHADYQELLTWLSHFKRPPQTVFITHGQAQSSVAFKQKVEKQFGWKCVVPFYLQSVELK
ncbi:MULTISPECIES: MBL fold metallo-hydrolase RNA specificity domain-containing protein [Legionella]|uniref:Metallo-beta lactamase family transporter protein n=1 Tax=Legionella maceachernii TaxID=466 RepID=A0A0W0VYT9_9GAMM|nr:MBL fold metallo-hydrolase [Legionella maceachernii]KTD25187.1 metallo-beta lactamase family transporter protein [Legionella maceachernii]SJZ75897.1 metallo-beta-lactamase family protein [Legionella maceachernii]SUP03158.1 Ribonuclease TTHA0252 [Legionella maceachernii]